MENLPEKSQLFADGSRGIYIPQHFAQSVVREYVQGVSESDWVILESGPDHSEYWDAWTDVLDGAKLTDSAGQVWTLYQDGDLWLIPADPETEADPETDPEDPTGYFVPEFDTTDKRACLQWARDDYDSGDQWGWVMSWLFDIAGELSQRGDSVPEELHYRPSPLGADVSEDRAPGLREIATDALTYAARVLNRYADFCRKADLDY